MGKPVSCFLCRPVSVASLLFVWKLTERTMLQLWSAKAMCSYLIATTAELFPVATVGLAPDQPTQPGTNHGHHVDVNNATGTLIGPGRRDSISSISRLVWSAWSVLISISLSFFLSLDRENDNSKKREGGKSILCIFIPNTN